MPNGRHSTRDIVRHPGGVVIVALDEQDNVYLEYQYRTALAEVLIELPAGKRDAGEDPQTTAQRELLEETGLVARQWRYLGELYTTPGFSDERLQVYLATGLKKQQDKLDDDEFLQVFCLPLAQAFQKAMTGQWKDAKTIAALAMAMEQRTSL